MNNAEILLEKAAEILEQVNPVLEDDIIRAYVQSLMEKRRLFLDFSLRHGTPVYLFDENILLQRAKQFTSAFSREIPGLRSFFALKSNNHPLVAQSLVKFGFGLDVSSGLELETALAVGCPNILFSGPGKTEGELDLAAANAEVVTVLIDSFGELDRLEYASELQNKMVRAGVRLTTEEKGLWRKFGIPLAELECFMSRAENCKHVHLCGLQFHTSWNLTPASQVSFLIRLGGQLGTLMAQRAGTIEFLDIGGGYWPPRGEWLHFSATPPGRIAQLVFPNSGQADRCIYASEPIDIFAREIGQTLRRYIFPHVRCDIFTEPGRWIVNDAMHILLTVVDKKAEDLVIVDGGTNIIGWERFETDYFPVINLSNPSLREQKCFIFGSLCTPHDVWGYSYFGDGIEPGDILMVPGQGAYTYSLRQPFIKPLAQVFPLET